MLSAFIFENYLGSHEARGFSTPLTELSNSVIKISLTHSQHHHRRKTHNLRALSIWFIILFLEQN